MMSLAALISAYGYPMALVGSLVEGEAVLVIGGFAAHQGLLQLPWLFLAVSLGGFTNDLWWFLLGRYRGDWLLGRFPTIKKLFHPQSLANRRPKLMSFWLRFMYGFRHLVPFSLGLSEFPTKSFLTYEVAGTATWVVTVGTLAYLFGDLLENLLGKIRHYEFRIIILVIIVIVAINWGAQLLRLLIKILVR